MGNKPMYRQIADAFREKINAGELKPGDALPTESSLQETFSVSRVTVRQALKLLADEQIIESIQGSGSYVKEERVITISTSSPVFTKSWLTETSIRTVMLKFLKW